MHQNREFITPLDALRLLSRGIPLLDVRSPGEHTKASIPFSINGGILSDAERDTIGRIYKEKGAEEAITFGHWFVQGKTKKRRIDGWVQSIQSHDISALFCARGGLRSQIAQQWLKEAGTNIPRVHGGYKALRTELLKVASPDSTNQPLIVITGHTGCGKTRMIHLLSTQFQTINLEHLAAHRGSAFGDRITPQPAQAVFENSLYLQLFKYGQNNHMKPTLVEDESRMIGKIQVPEPFFQSLSCSPRIQLIRPLPERVEIILQDYIIEEVTRLRNAERESSYVYSQLSQTLLSNLQRISKKLGGVRFYELIRDIQTACSEQSQDGSPDHHRHWIRKLLLWYYDPLYEKHLLKISPLIQKRVHPEELVRDADSIFCDIFRALENMKIA
ncbi:MAG: tRNA 2-selenouridine(34) synthase MnmH [Bdellovibrionota bacterium]